MLFPPLYFVIYLFLIMMIGLPISLVLGGYLFWRSRKKTTAYRPLLDEAYLKAAAKPKRSTLSLALISWAKAYAISVLSMVAAFVVFLVLFALSSSNFNI